jgi:hypothetical protein
MLMDLVVHAHLRRERQLHSLVLCPRDPPTSCSRKGYRNRHIVKLVRQGISGVIAKINFSFHRLWNFVIVMITPVIINRLQWKAYLIFMCTNLVFIPLVYFCYPETANLTLEEIDYLFTNPQKGAVKLSMELHRERKRGTRQESFVQTSASRRLSSGATVAVPSSLGKKCSEGGTLEQHEKV